MFVYIRQQIFYMVSCGSVFTFCHIHFINQFTSFGIIMGITIRDLVPDKRNMQKAYILHTTCTHSGGSTSTHRSRFDNTTRLEQYWRFFTPLLDVQFDSAKQLTELVGVLATGVGFDDDGAVIFRSIIPHDTIELGSMATLTGMYVRYWDVDGHEHFVDIDMDMK